MANSFFNLVEESAPWKSGSVLYSWARSANVLLCPHHGRLSGYDAGFVRLVSPHCCIMSDCSGADAATSSYDAICRGVAVQNMVPKEQLLRKVLSTRQDGTIKLQVSPENLGFQIYTSTRLKMGKRIKVFLSGTVNATNAQNLNCRALLQHLDPEKFEVRALEVYSGDLSRVEAQKCRKTWMVKYPAKIWHPIRLIQGILWSDVAYLCKPEYWKLQRFLVRVLHKKAFKTIEGAFIGTNLTKALALDKTIEGVRQSLEFTGHTYSITAAMKPVNEKALGLKTEENVLYLGADTEMFRNDVKREKLTAVAIIGSHLFYKGLDEFLRLAEKFPELTFHVIGSGMGKVDPQAEVARLGLKNVMCHGSLSHLKIFELLKNIQLHIFLSRSEGFPKVTLETAAAGVPSVVYDDYGAAEWIETGKNGYVEHTIDEVEAVVRDLLSHPEKLQFLSDGARELAYRFDWKVLVKEWERVIEGIARE